MNFLLTGACGFIGSHAFDEFIRHGHNIVVVDRLTYAGNIGNIDLNKCTFYQLDINETVILEKIVKTHNIDKIVNFAAETHVDNSISDASSFVRTNIKGVLSILNVCREHNIELIHLSTDEVYGPASHIPFDELTPLNPKNPYAATKAAADHLIFSYVNTYGIKCKIVRPSNNFGQRQHSEKFIPKIVKSVRERSNIPIYGDGSQKRQWTYVKDTAKIIYKIATECLDGVYNISDSNVFTNNDIVDHILGLMNCDTNLKTYVKDRPGHDKMYWITSRKINSLIEMEFTNFNTALKETVENS